MPRIFGWRNPPDYNGSRRSENNLNVSTTGWWRSTIGHYGDIVTVSIQSGMVAFNGRRFPYEPVSFDLVRGETKCVEFFRQGQAYTATLIEMRLSEDGNTFYFDAPARKRFVAVNDGWERGRDFSPSEIGSHDGHSEAVGVCIRIRYQPMSGSLRPRFNPDESEGDSRRSQELRNRHA